MPLPDQVLCLYEPESTSVFVNREALVDGTLPALSTPVAVCRPDRRATSERGWNPCSTATPGTPALPPSRTKHSAFKQLSSAPLVGRFRVRQERYRTKAPRHRPARPVPGRTGRRAAQGVSWYDAVALCNQMSSDALLPPAYAIDGEQVAWDRSSPGCRLPTEAEWQYACTAGTPGYRYGPLDEIAGCVWPREG
ncbi:SUMF1/EgtB/PvdO family nonheme iron enzyme [Kribbella sp. NPDC004138]